MGQEVEIRDTWVLSSVVLVVRAATLWAGQHDTVLVRREEWREEGTVELVLAFCQGGLIMLQKAINYH